MLSINTSRNTIREETELFKLKDNIVTRTNRYKLAMDKLWLKIRRTFQSNRSETLEQFPHGSNGSK